MIYIVIDIETVEHPNAKHLFAKKTYTAAANLKDPLKIQQSILEKRQADVEKAALHWYTGKIICICANVVGAEAKPMAFIGDNETELLSSFFDWLEGFPLGSQNQLQIIGKSSEYFDRPFIIGRALALDLGLPRAFRYVDQYVTDVDHIFSRSSQCEQRSNLSNYAFGLGIQGKTGHGSEVGPLYCRIQLGETELWKTIGDYCANDTDIATVMLKRWLKPYKTRNAPVSTPPSVEGVF